MRRHSRPQLEELGSRVLPSVTPLPVFTAFPGGASNVHLGGIVKQQDDGKGSGTYTTNAIQSGAGREYDLSGKASLSFAGLGEVTVSGWVHAVGFIVKGHAGGEITFTNAKGSVTIDLVGPKQNGFSPLPSQFTYTVEKGTGAYAHLTGSGSLTLKVGPASGDGTTLSGKFNLTVDSFHKG